MTATRAAVAMAMTLALATTLGRPAGAAQPATAPASCEPYEGLSFVCGPVAAEDLVRIEGTPWLLASGLAEGGKPGHVQLIDTRAKQWQLAWPLAASARSAPDRAAFADCTTPPDLTKFSAHGLSLRSTGNGRHRLLVVNHGGREAIEHFDVDSSKGTPVLTWIGCVVMPADVYVNSVVGLPQGGFLATKFYDPKQNGMGAIQAGGITGGVVEWAPGKKATEIPGTGLNGANGIETNDGGKTIFVAHWGKKEVVRFDRSGAKLEKDVITLTFNPDNLRWSPDGSLLVAGQRLGTNPNGGFALDGWDVVAITPATRAVKPVFNANAANVMQGISVGVIVDGTLWVGPFRGDRVGYATLR